MTPFLYLYFSDCISVYIKFRSTYFHSGCRLQRLPTKVYLVQQLLLTIKAVPQRLGYIYATSRNTQRFLPTPSTASHSLLSTYATFSHFIIPCVMSALIFYTIIKLLQRIPNLIHVDLCLVIGNYCATRRFNRHTFYTIQPGQRPFRSDRATRSSKSSDSKLFCNQLTANRRRVD